MRQRTVTDYVTLPIIPALHVRKRLIADLSAGVLLTVVEIGLLAFLMHLGLLDPALSRRPLGDGPNYEAMAHNPFSSDPAAHNAPFYWRVMTPWLVYLLTKFGLSLQNGFLLITVISLCGTVVGVYVLLRLFGATPWQALAVALLVQTQYAIGFGVLWGYEGTDALEYLLLVLAFILYWQDQPRWLVLALALGVLNREATLFAVAAFAGEQLIHRDWRRLKAYLPAYIVPILIFVVIQHAIYHVNHYSLAGTALPLRSSLVGRASTISLFGNLDPFALNVYHLTINSYGLLLPLCILQVIHPPCFVRRPEVWIFLLVTAITSTLFAGDNERLMIIACPVLAVAAWHELRWLAQWLKIPAAAIGFLLVLVQGIFLLGQFYKTAKDFSLVTAIKLLEPHWMSVLWLLSVFSLAGAAMIAGLWVLGFAVRLLYRYVQAW
jgi:hypothetical protein